MSAIAEIIPSVAYGEEYSGPFEFFTGSAVKIVGTSRSGVVVARTEHMDERHEYNVRFITRDGYVSRAWFNEVDLVHDTGEDA